MKKKSRNNTSNMYGPAIFRGVIVLILLGLGYGCWMLLSHVVSINNVECKMNTGSECPVELQQALHPLVGHSMFFINIPQVLEDAQSVTQPVSIVAIEKRLPTSVTVIFQPEPAKYLLSFGDNLVMVSSSGKVFSGISTSGELVTVEADQSLITSDNTIPTDIHPTIATIIDGSTELQLSLEKIRWVDKSTIQLSMKERAEVFILDSVSPQLQLHKLSLVLKSSEYRELAEAKQELDLRFNMPVLRTQP